MENKYQVGIDKGGGLDYTKIEHWLVKDLHLQHTMTLMELKFWNWISDINKRREQLTCDTINRHGNGWQRYCLKKKWYKMLVKSGVTRFEVGIPFENWLANEKGGYSYVHDFSKEGMIINGKKYYYGT